MSRNYSTITKLLACALFGDADAEDFLQAIARD
jgi:hypothetical protein